MLIHRIKNRDISPLIHEIRLISGFVLMPAVTCPTATTSTNHTITLRILKAPPSRITPLLLLLRKLFGATTAAQLWRRRCCCARLAARRHTMAQ
jgi:hypothetical protein